MPSPDTPTLVEVLRERADYWHAQWENGLKKNASSSWGKHVAYATAADLAEDYANGVTRDTSR